MLIDVLKSFFRSDYLSLVHPFWHESVAAASALQIHSRGLPPIKMLNLARPNEEPKFLLYRTNAYKPFTMTYWEKVTKTGQKIAKAEDFRISYPETQGIRLASERTLEDYTENSFPEFDSIPNFWFSWAINLYYDDPNAVVAFWPRNLDAPDNELREPYPFTFESTQVLEYVDTQYCVLQDAAFSLVEEGKDKVEKGLIFHALDKDVYLKAVQVGKIENYTFEVTLYFHNSGYLPALKVGRKIKKREKGRTLYDSDLSPCLPYLDEAISLISDQQVNYKINMHPEKWQIGDTVCPTCRGTKKRQIESHNRMYPNRIVDCDTCGGAGSVTSVNQFGVHTYKASQVTGANTSVPVPIPPAGYIDRPIDILEFTEKIIDKKLMQALAALNMEHLFEEPLVNSGVAKARDQQEFLSYIDSVGRHFIVNILEPFYEFTNNWRYGYLAEKQRYNQLPSIPVPQKFDILTLGILQDRLKMANEGGLYEIAAGLKIELAKREFGKDSIIVTKLELKGKLDPLPYLSQTEKNESILNSASPATSYQKYVISCNIDSFITRALEENKGFEDFTYMEQMKVLQKYADEIKPELQSITVNMPIVTTPDATTVGATANNPETRQAS